MPITLLDFNKLSDSEKSALVGTAGTPSDINRFLTELDARVPKFVLSLRSFLIGDSA